MKVRFIAVVVICTCLALSAATTASTRAKSAQATTLTVWLQEDARDNWPGVVNAANQAFEKSHPGVNVKVEYQTWNQHLTKFDATIAGNNVPDVIELGNTEMTKYMDAKAFYDITAQKGSIPNSRTWLKGLADSATYNNRVYGVPYYAGARAVIYRKDLYRAAGIRKLPTSLAEYEAVNNKLMKKYGNDRRFSALYFPGQYWLAAMSFVYDNGGAIARFRNGRWVGTLDSPQALAGAEEGQVDRPPALTGQQDHRRGQPVPGRRLRTGQGRLDPRERLGMGPRARDEEVRLQAQGEPARRLPDAKPHEGQVHADVPRRL